MDNAVQFITIIKVTGTSPPPSHESEMHFIHFLVANAIESFQFPYHQPVINCYGSTAQKRYMHCNAIVNSDQEEWRVGSELATVYICIFPTNSVIFRPKKRFLERNHVYSRFENNIPL